MKRERPPVIASGAEIDWAQAERAARALLKQCEDAGYAPPEAVDIHRMRLGRACEAINTIVDALRLQRDDEVAS